MTFNRLQGAVVLYLNVAVICASAFSLIWELRPAAFATLAAPTGGQDELATMLYFSLTTLTTTGYGDIVPVDPFAGAWPIWSRLSDSFISPSRSLAW